MKQNVFRKTEYYLYNYCIIDEIIKEIENDIIDAVRISGSAWLRSKGLNGNTVENQAIRLAENKKIYYLKKAKVILTHYLKIFRERNPKRYKFIKMKYFDKASPIEMYLETIELSMCLFKNTKKLPNKFKTVIIYNCQDFDVNMLEENTILEELQIIHSGIVDIYNISKFKNIKHLKIAHCNAISIPSIATLTNLEKIYLNHIDIPYDFDISKMPNLKFISLNGSNVQNKEEYIEKLYNQNKEIEIEFEENDFPIQ